MPFDGSDPCWWPDVPVSRDEEWRLRVAQFGDGYQQRTLDGINALNLTWALVWENREKDVINAMVAYLRSEGASSFLFRDEQTGLTHPVFCDAWNVSWDIRRKGPVWYGTLSAEFKAAYGSASDMPIVIDVERLAPQALVEMFVLDTTPVGGADIIRWTNSTDAIGGPIYWQGEQYQPLPVEATGFEMSGTGKLPKPTLRASNIGGQMGALIRTLNGGLGARVTRKRTFAQYLDGYPGADPSQEFPQEIFVLSRKLTENPIFLEMELSVAFDVANIAIPRRQVIASTCQWVYRSGAAGGGGGCPYAGGPVQDIYGNPTGDAAKDQCRKTLAACRARFGDYGVLPSSAFPASLLSRFA